MIDLSARSCILAKMQEENVYIDLEIIKSLRVSQSSTLSDAPIDSGAGKANVQFHMAIDKPTFELELALLETDEYTKKQLFDRIKQFMDTRTLCKFTCEFGVYDFCVITDLGTDATPDSYTSWNGTVTIKQITIVSVWLGSFHYCWDVDGNPIGGTPSQASDGGLHITLSEPEYYTGDPEDYFTTSEKETKERSSPPIIIL